MSEQEVDAVAELRAELKNTVDKANQIISGCNAKITTLEKELKNAKTIIVFGGLTWLAVLTLRIMEAL